MVSANREEFERVITRVSAWPEHDRITLARKILETVEGRPDQERRGYTAQEVIDLLKIHGPAPDDPQCQQILEEELVRKHGP